LKPLSICWKGGGKMYYMGVDLGSVSTDIALIDKNHDLVEKIYLRTRGNPIKAIQEGFLFMSTGIYSILFLYSFINDSISSGLEHFMASFLHRCKSLLHSPLFLS
jgi:hypothetical protein